MSERPYSMADAPECCERSKHKSGGKMFLWMFVGLLKAQHPEVVSSQLNGWVGDRLVTAIASTSNSK